MIRNLEWHAANGDVIRFGTPPFLLQFFSPGNPAGAAETVRAIRTDGQKTFNVAIEPLTPSMTGSISAQGKTYDASQKRLDEMRRRLQAALSPKHFGTLIFNNYSGSFKLRCRPITGAVFGQRIGNVLPIDIEWISDEPYWTQKDDQRISVGIIEKLWRFPWVIAPTVFGAITNEGFINNPTFIDIYPKIILSSTESTRVTVGNRTTGEFVTITHNIEVNQKLELNMSVPSATLIHEDGTRENVTHWTTIDSVFPWAVKPGENRIYSATDNPELSPIISLIWSLPEVGI